MFCAHAWLQVAEELRQTSAEHDQMLAERQEHEERLRKVSVMRVSWHFTIVTGLHV